MMRKSTCGLLVVGLVLFGLLAFSSQAMASPGHGAGVYTENTDSGVVTFDQLLMALGRTYGRAIFKKNLPRWVFYSGGEIPPPKVPTGQAPNPPVQGAALSPWKSPPDGTGLERDPKGLYGLKGIASGDGVRQNGLWVSASWTDLGQDQTAIAFDGDTGLVIAGYDRLFLDDRLVAGASLGYEWADLDTTFNRGTLDSDGFTVAPYAAWIFNQAFSFDLLFGYTWVDYDNTRNNGTVRASYDADRWMIGGGLNYNYFKKNWTLGLRIGYLYSSEDADAFTESDGTFNEERTSNVGIVTMGGQVGYLFGMVEPYLGAYYNHELVRDDVIVSNLQEQPSNDPDEVQGVGGINLYPTDTIRANLEVQHVFGRDDFDSTGVSLNLRWEF